MADLITRPNLPDPDGVYASLIETYEALGDDAQIAAFSARLILLLANHIGDPEAISQALKAAAEANDKAEARSAS
ncbi:DUF2783 domain-containing protein [Litorisediminicola beolgyonensis]|uniref:DUF2783 domain-containing protein n=1 Tax=Litorisediminicola beolgyonensis TaxID=1173614 RepID=A0ABW3ZLZ5_9RHOB